VINGIATLAAEVSFDLYVFDALMRDLVGHDRSPSAYLVYLQLWFRARGLDSQKVRISHQEMAEATGLSKSAVQLAIGRLVRRELIGCEKTSVTATPEYRVKKPWRRYRAS
jgi:CRP-like cAMP-binding protein